MFQTIQTLPMPTHGLVIIVGNIRAHMQVKVIFDVFTNYLTLASLVHLMIVYFPRDTCIQTFKCDYVKIIINIACNTRSKVAGNVQ